MVGLDTGHSNGLAGKERCTQCREKVLWGANLRTFFTWVGKWSDVTQDKGLRMESSFIQKMVSGERDPLVEGPGLMTFREIDHINRRERLWESEEGNPLCFLTNREELLFLIVLALP